MNCKLYLLLLCLLGQLSGALAAETPTPKMVTSRKQGDDVLLSLDVKRVELKALLEEIAAILEFSVVFHHQAKGTVTAKLVDVPWRQAVELILKSNSLVMHHEGTVLIILPDTAEPL